MPRLLIFTLVLVLGTMVSGKTLEASDKGISVQQAIDIAGGVQRKLGRDPGQMNVTVTGDARELKMLSSVDLEAVAGAAKGRPYWLVYHAIDHRKTPSLRGQSVFVIVDSQNGDVVLTIAK
jgi:hypothetical protein